MWKVLFLHQNDFILITKKLQFMWTKLLSIITCTLILTGCHSFHALSTSTQSGKDELYATHYNEALNIKALTYGDVTIAQDKASYRKLSHRRLPFSKVWISGTTLDPVYSYYILINSNATIGKHYIMREKRIHDLNVKLVATKGIPQSDFDFLFENIQASH